jgi:hypothetical protein
MADRRLLSWMTIRWGWRTWLNIGSVVGLAVFVMGYGQHLEAPDARVYWEVRLPGAYTEGGTLYDYVFHYSPAFAWWIGPLQWVDFPTFATLVMAGQVAGLAYLVKPPIALALMAAQVPVIWYTVTGGGLDLIAAAIFALALSRPALWSILLLSKVTPGIGVAWHLFRGEWRSLAIAVLATLAVAVPALILFPAEWWTFGQHLLIDAHDDGIARTPVAIRIALALALIGYAARTDRIYLVPVGVALVAHTQAGGYLIALAAIPLWRSSAKQGTQPPDSLGTGVMS